MKRAAWVAAAVVGVLVAGLVVVALFQRPAAPTFVTASATRATLAQTFSTSGLPRRDGSSRCSTEA